jgi:hypothetical protein
MESPRYLRPAQAARLWPNGASPSRVIRAILTPKKLRQRPGETIRLRAVRDSQGWLTTQEWVEDYLATLTADRLGEPVGAPSVAARAQRARARLAASGW